MDTRKRKTCHICGKTNLLQLNNHLTQMHGWNSEMKKEYNKLKQKGMGMGEYHTNHISPIGASKESNTDENEEGDSNEESNIEDEDSNEESSNAEEDENDSDDTVENDDSCSDEEDGEIWHAFRNQVSRPYAEEYHAELNELKEKYPEAPDTELRNTAMEKFKDRWINDAAEYLKEIITYYEKFQDNSEFFDKVLHLRDTLAKNEEPDEALHMAINVYKQKLGNLFSCGSFFIPE